MLIAAIFLLLWIVGLPPSDLTPPVDSMKNPVEPFRLQEHVRKLSEEFVPRDSEHRENLLQTAKYIQDALQPYAAKVAFQCYGVNGRQYVNVIAEYGPATNNILVVGAHYDAFSVYPGADDNASGVAGLIELGRLLKQLNLRCRVELVAYSLEEPPFFASQYMGSAVHAHRVKKAGKTVELMIALEMIGYFTEKNDSQKYIVPLLHISHPSEGNFIAIIDRIFSKKAQEIASAVNRFTSLPAYAITAPAAVPGIDFSDHRNYWANGFPAVMVTDTAFYRNPFYHSPNDTMDTLNYEKMADVIYGIFKYIEENYTTPIHQQEN